MASAETLRIPAFRRKHQIARKAAKAKVTKIKRTKKTMKKMTPRKMTRKIKPAKKMVRTARPLTPVGIVTHFYDKIGVAVLKLSGTLQVGDTIQLQGKLKTFDQRVTSMQIEHQPVETAKKGADLGLKVKKPVKVDRVAYLVR